MDIIPLSKILGDNFEEIPVWSQKNTYGAFKNYCETFESFVSKGKQQEQANQARERQKDQHKFFF